MSNDNSNIDPALRAIDGAGPASPATPRMRPPAEGTPQFPQGRTGYFNNMAQPAYYPPPMPFLSQTQQFQKLFELNPNLQQLQNAANKATEVLDDEEGEELDDEQLANSNAHARENLHMLLQSMTSDQLERFNIFRRSGLNKAGIKKVAAYSDHQMSNGVAQLASGVGKVFVGEIIAKAREVQLQRKETGSLTPVHLREAYRLYRLETGSIGPAKPLRGKRLFRK